MERDYITISEINSYIKSVIDKDFFLNKVFIKGEISNFKNHTRGHLYFTLKDDNSRLSAVMFESSARNLSFVPEDGMSVLIEGRISCYPATGSYQIYVEKMEMDGIGRLFIEYEKLKKKLEKEGLFDLDHKVLIPKYPNRIGVITASTGAAIKDIMSTIKRRYPICEVILFPSLVQGDGAKENIVRQIKKADEFGLDTIIVGRGGGSIEDLWAFNEEIVARAIYECKTPIISAVGHEIDFTIADFVADLRAPTPTGAAEMAVPTIIDVQTLIDNFVIRLNKNIKNMVNQKFIMLERFKRSYILKNPMSIYEIKEQKLDNLVESLSFNFKNLINNKINKYNLVTSSFVMRNPEKLLDKSVQKLDMLIKSIKLLNPLGILEKGYSVVTKDEKAVTDSSKLKKDDILNIKLYKGDIKAKVMEVKNGK
ncbi:MAG: exodeoxyribonuclease VII large subunit [Bacilli bacterium]|nr:exodeoxyribonuclease VII large subunit [Bacilli bacterium]